VSIQQWTKAREHLEAIEKLTDKPARRWWRDAILHLSRRFDELRQRHLDEAANLAGAKLPAGDAYALASHLYQRSTTFRQARELLALLERLAPVYKAQPAHVLAIKEYERNRYYQLSYSGRVEEAQALLKKLATEHSRDESLQREYAQTLAGTGNFAAA